MFTTGWYKEEQMHLEGKHVELPWLAKDGCLCEMLHQELLEDELGCGNEVVQLIPIDVPLGRCVGLPSGLQANDGSHAGIHGFLCQLSTRWHLPVPAKEGKIY